MKTTKSLRLCFTLTLTALLLPLTVWAPPRTTGITGQTILFMSSGPGVEVAPGVFVSPPSVSIPVSATFSVLSGRNGREVARVTTDDTGMYSLALHKGDYVLVPEPITMNGDCTLEADPIPVTVDSREMTLANIFYFYLGACSLQGTP